MTTFEEARQILVEKRGPLYASGGALFTVDDYGWETPERWILSYFTNAKDNGPTPSVDKVTGEYFEDYGPAGSNPFPDKTPVGNNPYP